VARNQHHHQQQQRQHNPLCSAAPPHPANVQSHRHEGKVAAPGCCSSGVWKWEASAASGCLPCSTSRKAGNLGAHTAATVGVPPSSPEPSAAPPRCRCQQHIAARTVSMMSRRTQQRLAAAARGRRLRTRCMLPHKHRRRQTGSCTAAPLNKSHERGDASNTAQRTRKADHTWSAVSKESTQAQRNAPSVPAAMHVQ
jgi:hypothetical protein